MLRTPKYTIAAPKGSGQAAKVYTLKVEFPDSIMDFGEDSRIAELMSGQICHHFVQSKFKQALAADPDKRSDAQKTLLKKVFDGEVLNGLDFIPKKRSAERKDNATVTRLRELWDTATEEKKKQWAKAWDSGYEFDLFTDEQWAEYLAELELEGLIEIYWTWNDAEMAKKAAAEADMLN